MYPLCSPSPIVPQGWLHHADPTCQLMLLLTFMQMVESRVAHMWLSWLLLALVEHCVKPTWLQFPTLCMRFEPAGCHSALWALPYIGWRDFRESIDFVCATIEEVHAFSRWLFASSHEFQGRERYEKKQTLSFVARFPRQQQTPTCVVPCTNFWKTTRKGGCHCAQWSKQKCMMTKG